MSEQEIWFEYSGLGPIGRFMPIHWKGWVVLFGATCVGLLIGFGVDWVFRALGRPNWLPLSIVIALLAVLPWLLPLALRHSRTVDIFGRRQ